MKKIKPLFSDAIAKQYLKKIGDTAKGRERKKLLQKDLIHLGFFNASKGEVLDIGAGDGQSLSLIPQDWHYHYLEPNQSLINYFLQKVPLRKTCYYFSTIEEYLLQYPLPQYIFLHATLAWIPEPIAVLKEILRKSPEKCKLSLLYFNKRALFLKKFMGGRYRVRFSSIENKNPGSLTPNFPLLKEDIIHCAKAEGFSVQQGSSIRTLSYFSDIHTLNTEKYHQVLEMEKEIANDTVFRELAPYMHLILER